MFTDPIEIHKIVSHVIKKYKKYKIDGKDWLYQLVLLINNPPYINVSRTIKVVVSFVSHVFHLLMIRQETIDIRMGIFNVNITFSN